MYASAIANAEMIVVEDVSEDSIRGSIEKHSIIRRQLLSVKNPHLFRNNTVAFVNVPYQIDKADIELPIYASLQEICLIFNLNCEQRRALYVSGKALLTSYFDDENSSSSLTKAENQSLLFIHGLGGSGKSVFIRSLVALSYSWLRPGSVLTSAPTGNAAVNVKGYTTASLIYKNKNFFKPVSPFYIPTVFT
jgi:hypothetical protein